MRLEQGVIEEFKKRRSRQRALAFAVAPIALVGIWLKHNALVDCSASALFLLLSAPVVIGALAFSLKNWRCPACDVYLGKRANPRACPNCGVRLRDDSSLSVAHVSRRSVPRP